MHYSGKAFLLCFLFFSLFYYGAAQIDMGAIQRRLPPGERQSRLDSLRVKWKGISDSLNFKLSRSGFQGKIGTAYLTGILNGFPVYSKLDNMGAAVTVGVDKVHNAGVTGSQYLNFNIGIWDGGKVNETHQEIIGRVTNQSNSNVDIHATHVTGTILATGINPEVKGMAPNAGAEIFSFRENLYDNLSFISGVYPGGFISNHSYGHEAGWYFEPEEQKNYWNGDITISNKESFIFGQYSQISRTIDSLCVEYSNHLLVYSSGNHGGQGMVSGYPVFIPTSTGFVQAPAGFNAPPDAVANNYAGYDMITDDHAAKNILTVGAVKKISNGFSSPGQIELCNFSATGPTDDGRIKPDIVAPGYRIKSLHPKTNIADTILDGTSMAAPVVTGASVLLQQRYYQKTGSLMNSAALKGLLIHTADAKNPKGAPDYKYGWGLLNAYSGYQFINNLNEKSWLLVDTVFQSGSDTISFYYNGQDTIIATLSWTDPPGIPAPVNILDDPAIKLVNDLDMQIYRQDNNGNKIIPGFYPYCLNPHDPTISAYQGNNRRDNVEKIFISDKPAGFYTLVISHKSTLQSNKQGYSLLVSGVSGLLVRQKPQVIFKSVQHNYNEITWGDFSSIETQYRIERKIEGENAWYSIGTVSANNLLYRDSFIVSGKIHFYRVVAENQNQTVSQTNETGLLTEPAPQKPSYLSLTLTNASPASRTLQLQWMDNETLETGYVIEFSRDGHFFEVLDTVAAFAGVGGFGTYVHSGLPQNGYYFYRVKTLWNNFESRYSDIVRYNFSFSSQSIDKVEYYFDTDPGFDQGYTVPGISGQLAADITSLAIPATLPDGIHTLFIRAKSISTGIPRWSNIYSAPFLKLTAATNTALLDRVEYFIDTDPGFGAGNFVTPPAGNQPVELNVDLTTVTTGLHQLYIRARDNRGFWSNIYTSSFVRLPGTPGPAVVTKLEYSIDNLPDFGAGVNVPVTANSKIDMPVTVDLSTTGTGLHSLYLRSMDNAGKWSNIYTNHFLSIDGNGGVKAVKQLEYYFDTDPGFGNGALISYPANAPKIIQDFNAPISGLTDGVHTLFIRAKDQNGNWSNIYGNSFLKLTGTGGERKIVELEYTVDNGLLIGTGTAVVINPAAKLDIALTLPPLNNGKHYLSIRVKDNSGLAGNIYADSFFVNDQQFCQLGANIYYRADTGTAFQWQENAGSGWINLTNGGNFHDVTKRDMKIEYPPTSWYGRKYRCVVDGVPGPEYELKFSNTWTGAVSTDWFDAANWSCGVVPDENVDVVVETGVPRYPSVNATGECRSLYMKAGALITVEGGQQLNIRGQ